MTKFSQRMGMEPVNDIIQIESMSNELKNSLWTAFFEVYVIKVPDDYLPNTPTFQKMCVNMWVSYFKEPLDEMGEWWSPIFSKLRSYFFTCEWYDVYNFLEFAANNIPNEGTRDILTSNCNSFLKKELSAYRFVGSVLMRITDEQEIAEIKEAISLGDSLNAVNEHLSASISLLSDKKSPDYRNCMKESISAVESLCKIITGDEKATLGEAIKRLKQHIDIHPALEKAFSSLYGYTSDSDGIRHALNEESDLDFEDAKFMLVSCSAFINYLKEKAIKAKIKL